MAGANCSLGWLGVLRAWAGWGQLLVLLPSISQLSMAWPPCPACLLIHCRLGGVLQGRLLEIT